ELTCASLAATDAGEHVEQRRVERAVGGHDLAPAPPRAAAVAIGHAPAGLAHDQPACGHVPGLELVLPVAVEPAARDVAEVERGAAVAAQLAPPAAAGAGPPPAESRLCTCA